VQLLKDVLAFYRTRRFITVLTRGLPLVPILSQINQVHTTLYYLSKIHFNIVHPPWHVAINTYGEMIYVEVSGLFHIPTAPTPGGALSCTWEGLGAILYLVAERQISAPTRLCKPVNYWWVVSHPKELTKISVGKALSRDLTKTSLRCVPTDKVER
jgi:hypothetical protein